MLGFWLGGSGHNDCVNETGVVTDTVEILAPVLKPSVGDVETGTSTQPTFILDIAANLVQPGSGAPDVHHVYTCYSKWELDGGEVDDPGTAASLVAAGRWYPSAIPGNVDGGENVGAYHLACNPPSTVQPTGQYIGIGGAITNVAAQGSYAIAK